MTDKCYSVRYDVSWPDVKKAMMRVKKFREQGLYLQVVENDTAYPVGRSVIRVRVVPQTYTVKVMGPPAIRGVLSHHKKLR